MSQQLSEAERKAAWETYYRQQALLQQQQYGIPTANYLARQPPPGTNRLLIANNPRYQEYFQHYQNQILQQQQQQQLWQMNNFQSTPYVAPSNWNNDDDGTVNINNNTVKMQLPKQRPLPRASPETNVGRPSSSAVAGPSLGRGRGRGISQKPAWMNNINNNDLLSVNQRVNGNQNDNVHNNNVDINNMPRGVQRPARGRGRGRGRGANINKPAWMTESNANNNNEQFNVIGRNNSTNNVNSAAVNNGNNHYRSPSDFAPPQQRNQKAKYPVKKKAPSSSSSSVNWPKSLKEYIKRNFDVCKTDEEKASMQTKLRPIITRAVQNNLLNEIDWKNKALLPLNNKPQQEEYINKKRKKKIKKKKKRNRYEREQSESAPRDDGTGDSRKRQRRSSSRNLNKPPGGKLINADSKELSKRQERANRFRNSISKSVNKDGVSSSNRASKSQSRDDRTLRLLRNIAGRGGYVNWDLVVVKGTCQELEKDYFRLTSPPDPSSVRPESILKKAIKAIKKKWAKKEVSYEWANNQLKAIRQDITVQHIKNEFVVKVYELHARICLEHDDIMEVNQCITQVFELYKSGIGGCDDEFTAYRILYLIYTNEKYNEGAAELNAMLPKLPMNIYNSPSVQHAMQVYETVALNAYNKFFQLYNNAPNMSYLFMSYVADAMRWRGLRCMTKTFRSPGCVPLQYLVKQLGYENEKEAYNQLTAHGALLFKNDNGEYLLDTAKSFKIYMKHFVFKVMDGDNVDESR